MASDTMLKMQRSSSSPAFVPRALEKVHPKKSDASVVGCIRLCSLVAALVPSRMDLRSVIYYLLWLAHEWSVSARLISKPFFTPGWGVQRELLASVGVGMGCSLS